MKKQNFILTALFILLFIVRTVFAFPTRTRVEEFKGMKSIEISVVSGDCIITSDNSKNVHVEIEYSESVEDAFKPEFIERGKVLKLKERWYGSGSGNVVWKITIPKNFDIEFSSASGDMEIESCSGDMEFETASGDIQMYNCSGDFEFKSASGDIEIDGCEGEFDISTASGDIVLEQCKGFADLSTASGDIELNDINGSLDLSTASGDIEIDDITFNEDSDFSTASGNIDIKFDVMPAVILDFSAASGDIALDLDGRKLVGLVQCITRKDRGRINSDFPFNSEEEFERNNRKYLKKIINTGTTKPTFYLETASGNILIKR